MASLDTPRSAVSRWAAAPGGQAAAEGWPLAVSALLLGASALRVASAARARAGAPRMDLELGDMNPVSPSLAREGHSYASSQRHDGTVNLSNGNACAAALQF